MFGTITIPKNMNTVAQLISGELKGSKRIKLACGLTEFPKEIYTLADTLEILDMTGNQLSSLPHDFDVLSKLKILFLSENNFTEFPSVLYHCASLEMIGFKTNKIAHIAEKAIPINTRWLILTDNQIKEIPKSIGLCHRLQKCMFAGNLLQQLPQEMANCSNLELFRISANKFETFPDWLWTMPKLSWLALAGNPAVMGTHSSNINTKTIEAQEIEVFELLGQGASGHIYRINLPNKQEAALKIFKGTLTSDGLPAEEMKASMAVSRHPNLVNVMGVLQNHPENKKGLIFELIPSHYKNLALSPSFDSCTRDVFEANTVYEIEKVYHLVTKMASVAKHLIDCGVMHGDFYAHNTLMDNEMNPLFGDFGAALLFDTTNLALKTNIEKLEVRAFGSFIDDVLTCVPDIEHQLLLKLKNLVQLCLDKSPIIRPSFEVIEKYLKQD